MNQHYTLKSGAVPGVSGDDLAHTAELHIWAGKGTGKPCAHCHRPILAEDIEYEVPIREAETAADADVLRFHIRCHGEWRDRR